MTLLFVSIAPIFIVLLYIYFQDKFEKEPLPFLLKNFFLGAFLSVLFTLVLTYLAQQVFTVSDQKSLFQQFIRAFFIVAFVEELSKYLIVKYHAQTHVEFNEPFDGIVYAVVISMGFAAVENLLYAFQFGMETALVRGVSAVPAHAAFGILMGYFMGKAKFSNQRMLHNLLGLFTAILFHGTYDFFLFVNSVPGIAIGAFVSLGIGIVLSKKAVRAHQKRSAFKV